MNRDFFGYDPIAARLASLFLAVLGVAVGAWAAASAAGTTEPRGWIRTGLSLGLAFAAVWVFVRLRPRADWGARVGPASLTLSRVLAGASEVRWSRVKRLERRGKHREQLLVVLSDQDCLTVSARMFRRRSDFEALATAMEQKLPPPQGG